MPGNYTKNTHMVFAAMQPPKSIVNRLGNLLFIYLEKEENDLLNVSSLELIDKYLAGSDGVQSLHNLRCI